MDKVSLETFQRDFLVTHLKNKPECVLDCLQQKSAIQLSFGDLMMQIIEACWEEQTAYRCDSWYACEISIDKCYFAHGDFRGYCVPKDERFVDFLDGNIQEIESNSFPMSREIRSEWRDMPRVMVQERDAGDWTKPITDKNATSKNIGRERYYVLDGQLRVIRHWYHRKTSVPAYIYRGAGKV